MSSRAEQYRQLEGECLELAYIVPAGAHRDTLIEMAQEWGRLAAEQEQRQKTRLGPFNDAHRGRSRAAEAPVRNILR